jgi:hypothetical protein
MEFRFQQGKPSWNQTKIRNRIYRHPTPTVFMPSESGVFVNDVQDFAVPFIKRLNPGADSAV